MQGMFRRFNARELVVDKGEKESRGNNFSLKFHFALVEEHPLDIHAAIRIIAKIFSRWMFRTINPGSTYSQ